jgi:hypothetical protein
MTFHCIESQVQDRFFCCGEIQLCIITCTNSSYKLVLIIQFVESGMSGNYYYLLIMFNFQLTIM